MMAYFRDIYGYDDADIFIGDGMCDTAYNSIDCDFDGGDCCLPYVNYDLEFFLTQVDNLPFRCNEDRMLHPHVTQDPSK